MKKLALVLVTIVCCVSFIGSACAAVLVKGDVVYVRSNLRAEGSKILWHNMSSLKGVVPVSTEVRIKRSDGGLMTFVTSDTNKTYYVYANSGQWDKYFVKNRNELGLEKLSIDRKDQVEKSDVVVGMSKEEVYASKGCPAYSAWGMKTEGISFDSIMRSDKWYYNTNTRGHDVMVTFANGVVVKTGGFEK